MTKETLSDKSILIGNADAGDRDAETRRVRRHRRGHPLLQRGPQAAPAWSRSRCRSSSKRSRRPSRGATPAPRRSDGRAVTFLQYVVMPGLVPGIHVPPPPRPLPDSHRDAARRGCPEASPYRWTTGEGSACRLSPRPHYDRRREGACAITASSSTKRARRGASNSRMSSTSPSRFSTVTWTKGRGGKPFLVTRGASWSIAGIAERVNRTANAFKTARNRAGRPGHAVLQGRARLP